MLRHEILLAGALALAACGSGGNGEPATLLPTSSSPATIATTVAPTTVTSDSVPPADTSPPDDTLPATTAPGTIGLTPGGPWTLVDSAPGITTPGLVYELMPKLWVYLPVQEDIANGITWTFSESDRAIIEAYLQARLVYFRAVTSSPMDLEDPGWQTWYADGGEFYRETLQARQTAGQVANLDVGVVLRPEVIGDERTDTNGIVFDCVLDGGVFRLPDGSLAEGSTMGVLEDGIGFRMSIVDGSWKVSEIGTQPEACQ